MTSQTPLQQALQDLQDQIDSITYTFATSLAPNSVKANTINASSLQTLTSQTGTLNINNGGSISSGQTGYNTGTGFFLGTNSGTAQMSVGNPSGNNMTWDGTNLSITGNISATTGTIGGWTIGATTLTGGDVTLDSANGIILNSSGVYGDALVFKSGGLDTASLYATSGQANFSLTSGGAGVSIQTNSFGIQSTIAGISSNSTSISITPKNTNGSAVDFIASDSSAKFSAKIYPGLATISQQSTGYIAWDGTNLEMLGAPLKLDHAFYPATTSNTAQTTISLQANAGFGLQLNGTQLSMTGAASTSILNVTTCTLKNGTPTASMPSGVSGLPVFLNGVGGYLAFYAS